MACLHCSENLDPTLTQRTRVLELLALVENSEALPADARLRISQKILAWITQSSSGPQCRRTVAAEPRPVATAA